jgi:hypothetical protein
MDLSAVPSTEWLKRMEKRAMSLECWLARAGIVPVFCHIKFVGARDWFRQEEQSKYSEGIKELVSKLVPHVAHWKNICLQLPFECLTPLFDLHEIVAPQLKVLSISHVALGRSDIWYHRFGTENDIRAKFASVKFPVGDKLRELRIDVPPFVLKTIHPWVRLEELTMTPNTTSKSMLISPNRNVFVSDALHVLRNLPNLKRCTLAIGGHQALGNHLPRAPITLPKLQKLSLHAKPLQFSAFLRAVLLPKLERFIILKCCDPKELLLFLARLTHPLTELSFVRIHGLSEDDLFHCLQLVPSLKHLHISSAVGAQVLRALTPSAPTSNSPSYLCPKLELVEFRCRNPFDGLVEMIQGRRQPLKGSLQLKKARLHLTCHELRTIASVAREAELIGRLRKCYNEGLDIKWQL